MGIAVIVALDHQPLPAASLLAVATSAAHALERPGALELVAVEFEIDLAVVVIAVDMPLAAIPDHHGAGAVTFRNHAFEIAVVERMILDLHRQMLLSRLEARPLGQRPAAQHAILFQPQIVVQPAGVMLVNHETRPRPLPAAFAARLRRAREVSLVAIGLEVSHPLLPHDSLANVNDDPANEDFSVVDATRRARSSIQVIQC